MRPLPPAARAEPPALPKLRGTGSVSTTDAERIAHEHYTEFNAKQKAAERQVATDADDLEELNRIADLISGRP